MLIDFSLLSLSAFERRQKIDNIKKRFLHQWDPRTLSDRAEQCRKISINFPFARCDDNLLVYPVCHPYTPVSEPRPFALRLPGKHIKGFGEFVCANRRLIIPSIFAILLSRGFFRALHFFYCCNVSNRISRERVRKKYYQQEMRQVKCSHRVYRKSSSAYIYNWKSKCSTSHVLFQSSSAFVQGTYFLITKYEPPISSFL